MTSRLAKGSGLKEEAARKEETRLNFLLPEVLDHAKEHSRVFLIYIKSLENINDNDKNS